MRTALLVEDEAVIALDLEDALAHAGLSRFMTVSSCAAAKDWLSTNTPDAAILDISLRDGPSTEIALTLLARCVPFIVYTGIDEGPSPVFDRVERLMKPTSSDAILSALRASVQRAEAARGTAP